MAHASHPAILKRLKRAQGHVASIIVMIEEGRPCLDLAQQLHAVEAALSAAKRELIQDHMEACLDNEAHTGGARAAIAEFRALAKYL
jgi:uncharacterized protein